MNHCHSGISSTTLSLQIRSHRSQKTRDFKINIVDFKINIVVKTHNLSSSIKSNQTQSTPIRPRHSRKTSPSLHSTPLHSTPLHSTSKSEEKPHIAMARDVPENRYEVPNAHPPRRPLFPLHSAWLVSTSHLHCATSNPTRAWIRESKELHPQPCAECCTACSDVIRRSYE